jgi:hypothetical protein
LEGVAADKLLSKEARELWGLGSHPPPLLPWVEGGGGFPRDSWRCFRDILPLRCVLANHGQGLSISLALFYPLGIVFKEKEQLHVGDFYPFAFPLTKQSNWRIVS